MEASNAAKRRVALRLRAIADDPEHPWNKHGATWETIAQWLEDEHPRIAMAMTTRELSGLIPVSLLGTAWRISDLASRPPAKPSVFRRETQQEPP